MKPAPVPTRRFYWSKDLRTILAAGLLLAPLLAAADEAALLVIEKKAGEVGFYTSSGRRLTGVKVGETPHEVVIDPNGRFAYVSDNGVLWMDYEGPGGNTISIVDLQERRKIGVMPTGKYHRPHGLSIDPSTRRMLVTSENPDALVLLDLDGRALVQAYDNGGKAPHMVAFDRTGEWAFASNTNSDNVAAVRIATGEIESITGCRGPQGGAMTRDGSRYYVACRDSGTIQVIDVAARRAVGEIQTAAGVNRVALTPDEKTLVYSIGGQGEALAFADVAALKETARVKLGGSPLSCSLTGDGRFAFAGVQDRDEIYVVSTAERKIVQIIKTPEGHGPDPIIEIGRYEPPGSSR